jgi:hypothetical protein
MKHTSNVWPRVGEIADQYAVPPLPSDAWPVLCADDGTGRRFDVSAVIDAIRARHAVDEQRLEDFQKPA